ncbi:MAG TPA: enoyl-CoA hydratase/isomerase family protein [Acidimicrobiales bacterium]|nr:enoyl-CoA hydratase/isomerase family protein [Acidimicrobiales bacterium]
MSPSGEAADAAAGDEVGGGGPDKGRVEVEARGKVALVTLQRHRKLNALSGAMEEALAGALESPEVTGSRSFVITGGPQVFSAGADVSEMSDVDPESIFAYYRASGGVYEAVASMPQPSVSAISGYCLGGGLELALATDFRVADETAVFGLPEVSIGILPSSGGIHRLVRMLGTARARELVLARGRLPAREALALGLVTEVVPAGEALARALELAGELAELPPLATALARRAIEAAGESSRDVALLVEQLAYAALSYTPVIDRRGSGRNG